MWKDLALTNEETLRLVSKTFSSSSIVVKDGAAVYKNVRFIPTRVLPNGTLEWKFLHSLVKEHLETAQDKYRNQERLDFILWKEGLQE